MAWTVTVDPAISGDPGSWDTHIDGAYPDDNGSTWHNHLVSPTSSSFLHVGQAVEDILVDPENMTLEVEEIQADNDDWTILYPSDLRD